MAQIEGAFQRVARADELAEGAQRLIEVAGQRLLLCRSEGQVFAVQNRCTHDHEQLAGGVVRKCTIVCPYHGARFSLKTGAPFGPPAFEPLDTFPVREIDGHIEVGTAPTGR
ncbi:MAG: non-heme iron oxygenase ferredoxin subunit [Caulobacterales bacterium]|nr:non-heme iron oxygenase ferredoxin subunit [Caulobacterales bacterium]